jgi:hypothetical protein
VEERLDISYVTHSSYYSGAGNNLLIINPKGTTPKIF